MSSQDPNAGANYVAPAVLGSEFIGYENDETPSDVYVPSQRLQPGASEIELELRPTEAGGLALLAYSSLELLVGGCGEQQPWISTPRERISDLQRQSGADTILWDIELPHEMRHGSEEETA
ncbi:hypothetical protein GIY23_05485 [Allosaccharopolyspora coralli]|uniref:Uncharacterized protein n=1 Tax=Allosaccharopolyspora coralli TaxID=2665642 RepID=A0A5Q3Q3P8_9PSEU|nr:SAV_915 family protein [Allosaccharopolyspora coralli]QGK69062.1 hypothetical protein GIY23_05485 [Allosaccharopolyspora coralli]